METSRWRGGGGEDGGDGARWKEDGGVVRRGQVVAAGARAKGDASRRSGVSPVSSSPNFINCSVQSTFVGFVSGQFGVKGRSCSEEMCHTNIRRFPIMLVVLFQNLVWMPLIPVF